MDISWICLPLRCPPWTVWSKSGWALPGGPRPLAPTLWGPPLPHLLSLHHWFCRHLTLHAALQTPCILSSWLKMEDLKLKITRRFYLPVLSIKSNYFIINLLKKKTPKLQTLEREFYIENNTSDLILHALMN